MNIERLKLLQEKIRKEPHVPCDAPAGFNMRMIEHPCGTPSCIMGYAVHMFASNEELANLSDKIKTQHRMLGMQFLGEILLDISHTQSEYLFFPDSYYNIPRMADITPAEACAAIDKLISGEEDLWEFSNEEA